MLFGWRRERCAAVVLTIRWRQSDRFAVLAFAAAQKKPSASSSIEPWEKVKSITGYIKIRAFGKVLHCGCLLIEIAADKVSPALSPPTAILSGSAFSAS